MGKSLSIPTINAANVLILQGDLPSTYRCGIVDIQEARSSLPTPEEATSPIWRIEQGIEALKAT